MLTLRRLCHTAAPSFDHLVGAGEQRRRHVEAEHPGRHVIDDQLELNGLPDRQIGFAPLRIRAAKMPDPKDDPKSSEWRPNIFARDQWHCRICGDRFLYSEMVRKHIANEHNETMPPSMYEYFHGAVWQRKKLP
jgi:hypothetical protein